LLQARIWHFDHAGVWLNGAERVVLGCNAGLGQGIKQGGFTNVGQAHDAAFQAHKNSLSINIRIAQPGFAVAWRERLGRFGQA
jgi:hypothetical protein